MESNKNSSSPVEPQPEDIKTMAEWEAELQCFFKEYDPKEKIAFKDISMENAVYIDEPARTEWLKENGFELTRENYMNVNLTVEKTEE